MKIEAEAGTQLTNEKQESGSCDQVVPSDSNQPTAETDSQDKHTEQTKSPEESGTDCDSSANNNRENDTLSKDKQAAQCDDVTTSEDTSESKQQAEETWMTICF